MESQINAMPQDLILLESTLWIKEKPDLLTGLEASYKEFSIIHIIPSDDQESIDVISSNGIRNYLYEPTTAKEILLTVNQSIRYKELTQRYQQMRNEFLEANKNLSNKSKELQELIAFNTNILESINVGIMAVDSDFKINSWNSKMSEITGINRSLAIGADLFQTLPWLNIENVSVRVRSVITDGKVTELGHLKCEKRGKSEVYADYKISPIRQGKDILGAVITVDDVTRKIHYKDEHEGSQKYISNLVKTAADAIVSYDSDGIIVTWNEGACDIFGYNSQEAIGRPWDFIASEKGRKRLLNLLEFVRKSGAVSNFETEMKNKSGKTFTVSVTISPVRDTEGNVYGISAIYRDLSEGRRLKKQLTRSQRVISYSKMVAGVARDINTPLTSLSSSTSLLVDNATAGNISEITSNMQRIEAEADHIALLVKDLLWYGNVSEDSEEIVEIHTLIEKSLFFTGFLINLKNIDIHMGFDAQKSEIMGNSRELIQTLMNLFTNAQAAMPDGGALTIETTNVKEDSLLGGQETICIKIKDTGIGIPDENLPRVFGQFFTTKPEGKGNGLGLYVVKSVIEDHGGKIEVESLINQGTCFTIWLPC